jgi:hypothetical protein
MVDPEPLRGIPSDYDILPGGIPRNRKTGEMGRANNTNGYTFVDLKWLIVNGKLALQSPLPGASGFTQADLDKARADGRAEGIAAVRAALAGVR